MPRRRSGVFVVNCEQVSYFVLVFRLLALNNMMLTGGALLI